MRIDMIENKLWTILDSFRGKQDISELKELFISLIFLKQANEKFIKNATNIIEVPKEANWIFLLGQLGRPNFSNYLFDAFNSLERENKQLYSTFSSFDFGSKYGKVNDSKFLSFLFKNVSNFNLDVNNVDFSNTIKNLLIVFANSEKYKGANYTTPDSIAELMIELLNPKNGTVLDSTCGIGDFFSKIKDRNPQGKFTFYGQEIHRNTLAMAKLKFAFSKNSAINFSEAKSTLKEDFFLDLKTDYVIMHPPFSVKSWQNDNSITDPRFHFGLPPKQSANLVWIQHAIFHLNNTGKAAILLNNSTLSTGGQELSIRKKIIQADLIEAIITLPSQLLTNTSIPSSIWILNKNKTQKNKVLFVEASKLGKVVQRGNKILSKEDVYKIKSLLKSWQEDEINLDHEVGFSNSINISEIAENGYVLNPSKYIRIEELQDIDLSKSIRLGDILEFRKPLKIDSELKCKNVSISDLCSSPDAYLLDTNTLKKRESKRDFKLIDDNILLIAKVGNKLKPTFFKTAKEQIVFSSNSIYTFKVDTTRVFLDYFIAELYKDYIKAQIENFRKGTGMPYINQKDLLDIKIIVPPLLEQQKDLFEKEKQLRFQSIAKNLGFEKEIAKLKEAQMKDLGSKKHNIMQHLNNVKSSTDVLSKMMELNNGILKMDEIINPKTGVTVEKRFLRLKESIDRVIYYVDNITNELKLEAAEIINPVSFINECKERGFQDELFSIEVVVDKESFMKREPLISISKADFEELYNNIIENAFNHGFINQSKSYIFRISIAQIDGCLEINFTNNGKPFPKGISRKIGVKGEKAGVTAGTGIGLWKVSEIAKHFECELEVLDEPSSEFPVGFKFIFELKTL